MIYSTTVPLGDSDVIWLRLMESKVPVNWPEGDSNQKLYEPAFKFMK